MKSLIRKIDSIMNINDESSLDISRDEFARLTQIDIKLSEGELLEIDELNLLNDCYKRL